MDKMKVYSFTTRNPIVILVAGLGVAAVGATLVVVGLALLGGVVVVGGALGAAALAYRRLRGKRGELTAPVQRRRPVLDPELEVFPDDALPPPRSDQPPLR
ncbi:MAG TPA: hypothetical protein VJ596_06915 [Gemmatimonadaceae bacterium]|nr:hypothetical protein [Gemmatimonadaceae bacterium]